MSQIKNVSLACINLVFNTYCLLIPQYGIDFTANCITLGFISFSCRWLHFFLSSQASNVYDFCVRSCVHSFLKIEGRYFSSYTLENALQQVWGIQLTIFCLLIVTRWSKSFAHNWRKKHYEFSICHARCEFDQKVVKLHSQSDIFYYLA